MLNINKTISVTGISSVKVTENGNQVTKQVAYINANIPENGDFSINKSIQERELFNKFTDDVISDFNEFEKYVYKLSKGIENE